MLLHNIIVAIGMVVSLIIWLLVWIAYCKSRAYWRDFDARYQASKRDTDRS